MCTHTHTHTHTHARARCVSKITPTNKYSAILNKKLN